MIVFLDSGVLGILSNPNKSEINANCEEWLYGLLCRSVRIMSSEICRYEVKRSLVLAQKKTGCKTWWSRKIGRII